MPSLYQRLVMPGVAICALLMVLSSAARATDYTWTRPASARAGYWSDAPNWAPSGIPGAGDVVNINSGAGVVLNGDRTVAVLNLSSAYVDGNALRVTGAVNWTGGEISSELTSEGTFNVSGGADKVLTDGLINNGTLTWSSPAENTGRINLYGGYGYIQNSGVFQAASDGTIFFGNGIYEDIRNSGVFAKVGGSGVTRVTSAGDGSEFVQKGTVRCDVGVLSFGDEGSSLLLNDVNTLSGAGRIRLSGGVIYLNRPTTVSGNIDFVAGTLRGDALGGLVSGGGVFNWLGGVIDYTTNFGAGMNVQVSGASPKYLDGTLNNSGTVTWSAPDPNSGSIVPRYGNRFNNLEGATFVVASDGTALSTPDSYGYFYNSGTVLKTSGGTSHFQGSDDLVFYNNGVVNVPAGALTFNSRFDANQSGRLTGSGRVRLDSGTFHLNVPTALGCTLEMAGGTLSGNSDAMLTNAGGGRLEWTSGSFINTINIGSGLACDISGSALKTLDGVINNNGAVTWSAPTDGTGRIVINGGDYFNNRGFGTFTATTGGSVFSGSGSGTILNEGTFSLAPGISSSRIAAYLENAGTLNVGRAQLSLEDFVNKSNGVVNMTLGGIAPGSQHGQLSVVDYAGLAGTLSVSLQPGFAPASGNRFVVLTNARREGTFSTIRGLSLGAGRLLSAQYDPGLTLTARFSPAITALAPRVGFVKSSVVIGGANLGDVASVRFAGNVAAAVTSRSVTRLVVTVPLGAQSGPIALQNVSGTVITPAFAVLPRVVNASPRAATPGATVVLTGDGLFNGALPVVRFDGVPARVVSAPATGDRLTVTVPAGATSGFITVTTRGGAARSAFSFLIAPQITTFSPGRGAPGASVVVTGTSFAGVRAVYFGATPAAFKVESPTRIRVTVPRGARTARIAVVTAAGTAASPSVFVVLSSPAG